VPPGYDAAKPTPVVLILYGGQTNAQIMQGFCGMDKKADAAGFLAVYPNGQGRNNRLHFNTWGRKGLLADDVKFVAALLDDLSGAAQVDANRVFATGISDGAMMCYLLAAELSDRIAAIAPVSGTLAIEKINLKRPVPVLHFHGTADKFVPFEGPTTAWQRGLRMLPVEEEIQTWAKLDGCPEASQPTALADTAHDGTTVTRKVYGPGKGGAEVVLYFIEGGGHTWPGRQATGRTGFAAGEAVEMLLGKSTQNLSANDLMWEFFQKHPMK
jgi:polyhydroxybutyrate depolymerase